MILGIGVLLITTLAIVSFSPAFAQHHSGAVAPPVDFGGMQVALSTVLSPEDFTAEGKKSANLSIRFFDSESNTNIKSVTYRVQIFHDEDLVASEYFFDEDGNLEIEIKPTTGCQNEILWKCTKYFGEKHTIAGAYYARGDLLPVIQGPVFEKSGVYTIKTSIVGATNPRTMTASDLHFETFISIPQKYDFIIQKANEQIPVSIKSFENEVLAFNFEEFANIISYEIKFDWNHVDHNVSSTKQTIHLPKSLSDFKYENDLEVSVEGIKLNSNSFLLDVTLPDQNIIRINIPHEEIMILKYKLEKKDLEKNTMKVEVFSGDEIKLNQLDFAFENGYSAKVTWNPKVNPGESKSFLFSFFDEKNNPAKNILYAYSITDSSGAEIFSKIGSGDADFGILAPYGLNHETVLIPSDERYQLKLILIGKDAKNFENFFTANEEFVLSPTVKEEPKSDLIPEWIKNNAGWWASGQIDDSSFVQGIQFLIKENIIYIPSTVQDSHSSNEIPEWIKNNAGWWANGQIDDSSFVQGIQFLIKNGIIVIS